MRRSIQYVKLKHLNPSGYFPSGNPRFYYRPKGQMGIPMPDLPIDHPEFLKAYAKAAGVKPRRPVISGSVASAVFLYKSSDDFKALATGTRATRGRMLDELAELYGSAQVKGLRKEHVDKDLSRFAGHARNNHLKAWRGFGKWLHEHHGLPLDPTDGVKRSKVQKAEGHLPWQIEDIETYRRHWSFDTMERLALELIYWTGARVSDAIRLGPQNVDSDGWLVFTQQKTGGEVAIPFERELPEFAECFASDLKMLHRALAAQRERHLTFLHTQKGTSRSSKSVSQWFAAKTRAAGIYGKTAHGLRKARARALAEAGGTSPQIGAWTGHESLKEIEHYIRRFSKRKALSKTEKEPKVPTSVIKFQKSR